MVGKKGASGRRPSGSAGGGGDKPSENSKAKRPTRAFSLPWELLERLDTLPDGERSGVVEEALTRYFARNDLLAEIDLQLAQAAAHLFFKRDLLEFRNEQIDGRMVSLEERLASLEADIGYVVRVLERLFYVRRHPVEPNAPSVRQFDDLMHEASSEYLKNEELLRPNVYRREHDLAMAAEMEAFENRKAEVQAVLEKMPFMSDPRFYIATGLGGLALFDRKYHVKQPFDHEAKDFELFSVRVDRGEVSLTHSKVRPYCRFGPLDSREVEIVSGIENVAATIPVLVADYLSFRRFDGVVPGGEALSRPDEKPV